MNQFTEIMSARAFEDHLKIFGAACMKVNASCREVYIRPQTMQVARVAMIA
jgi:hypothetical protein